MAQEKIQRNELNSHLTQLLQGYLPHPVTR